MKIGLQGNMKKVGVKMPMTHIVESITQKLAAPMKARLGQSVKKVKMSFYPPGGENGR